MLREGTYLANVCAFEGVTYSTNGTPQIAIQFSTPEGTISTWLYLSEKAAKYTIEKLRILGWTGNDVSEVTMNDLKNEVEIVVAMEDDQNGVSKARVKWINAPGGAGIKAGSPMADAQKKALGAKLKGLCMSIGSTQASAPSDDSARF